MTLKHTDNRITTEGLPYDFQNIRQLTTRAAARALPELSNGEIVLVHQFGIYRYDPCCTLEADEVFILTPDTLPGRLIIDQWLGFAPPAIPGIPAPPVGRGFAPTVQFETFDAGSASVETPCSPFMPQTNIVMDLHSLDLRDSFISGDKLFSWTDSVSGIEYTRGGTYAYPAYVEYTNGENFGVVETDSIAHATHGVRLEEVGAALAAAVDRSTDGGVTISFRADSQNAGLMGLFGWYNGPDRPLGQLPYVGLWVGGGLTQPPVQGQVPMSAWLGRAGDTDSSYQWLTSQIRDFFFRCWSLVLHDDGTASLYDNQGDFDTTALVTPANRNLPGDITGGGLSSWLLAPDDWWGRLQGIVVHDEALSLANITTVHNAFICREQRFYELQSW